MLGGSNRSRNYEIEHKLVASRFALVFRFGRKRPNLPEQRTLTNLPPAGGGNCCSHVTVVNQAPMHVIAMVFWGRWTHGAEFATSFDPKPETNPGESTPGF